MDEAFLEFSGGGHLTTRATVKTRSFKVAGMASLVIVVLIVVGFIAVWVVGSANFVGDTEQKRQEFCQEARELGGEPPPGC